MGPHLCPGEDPPTARALESLCPVGGNHGRALCAARSRPTAPGTGVGPPHPRTLSRALTLTHTPCKPPTALRRKVLTSAWKSPPPPLQPVCPQAPRPAPATQAFCSCPACPWPAPPGTRQAPVGQPGPAGPTRRPHLSSWRPSVRQSSGCRADRPGRAACGGAPAPRQSRSGRTLAALLRDVCGEPSGMSFCPRGLAAPPTGTQSLPNTTQSPWQLKRWDFLSSKSNGRPTSACARWPVRAAESRPGCPERQRVLGAASRWPSGLPPTPPPRTPPVLLVDRPGLGSAAGSSARRGSPCFSHAVLRAHWLLAIKTQVQLFGKTISQVFQNHGPLSSGSAPFSRQGEV